MSDDQNGGTGGQTEEPTAADAGSAFSGTPIDPEEVEKGKVFAILSYALSMLGLPFFLIPLIMRDNEFSLYHSKQTLMIWLIGLAISAVGVPLTFVCIGIPILALGGIFTLVLWVFGLVFSIQGRAEPLPLVGGLAENWFRGVVKAQ